MTEENEQEELRKIDPATFHPVHATLHPVKGEEKVMVKHRGLHALFDRRKAQQQAEQIHRSLEAGE